MIAQASRFEVQPAEALGHPGHALVEELSCVSGLVRLRRIPRDDDEEATIEHPPLVGEGLNEPAVRVAQLLVVVRGRRKRGRFEAACPYNNLKRVGQRVEKRGPARDNRALLGLTFDSKGEGLTFEDRPP